MWIFKFQTFLQIWLLLYWVLYESLKLDRFASLGCGHHLFRWQQSVRRDGWLTCNAARRPPEQNTYPCLVFTATGGEMFACPIHHALLSFLLHLLLYLFIFLLLKCLQPHFLQRPSCSEYCNHIRSLVQSESQIGSEWLPLSLVQHGTAEYLHSD